MPHACIRVMAVCCSSGTDHASPPLQASPDTTPLLRAHPRTRTPHRTPPSPLAIPTWGMVASVRLRAGCASTSRAPSASLPMTPKPLHTQLGMVYAHGPRQVSSTWWVQEGCSSQGIIRPVWGDSEACNEGANGVFVTHTQGIGQGTARPKNTEACCIEAGAPLHDGSRIPFNGATQGA